MSSIIELVTHPHAFETLQARLDFAEVAGVDIFENPWWYRDKISGETYYDLCTCIGWPDEVTAEHGEGQPGYLAVIGIRRPRDAEEKKYDATKAVFYLLEEYQHFDVPTLLAQCVALRDKYGYGISRELLPVWYGDYERFATALALSNERLTRRLNNDEAAVMITPPSDFELSNRFEVYLRALKGVMQPGNVRLYFCGNTVLKGRLKGFQRDDPAVMAVGGLVHTLLGRTMWMGHRSDDNCFNLKEVL